MMILKFFKLALQITLLSAFCLSLLFSSLQSQDDAKDVDTLKQELESTRTKAESLIQKQAGLYDQLAALDHELELSSRLLRKLRRQTRDLTAEVDATSDTLAALQGVSHTESQLYENRLHQLYIIQTEPGLLLPFAPFAELSASNNSVLYQKLVGRDNLRLAALGTAISSQAELLDNLKSRKAELESAVVERRREEANMKSTLQERERLLAKVKGQQRELDQQLNELQESSATVGDIFSSLDDELRRTTDQLWQQQRELNLRLKGNLRWPVKGHVVTDFGTKTDRRTGLSSKSNGINITTKPGRPVVAALTGRVLYIGFARGLENFLVVDHGGSIYSLYGNLADLKVTEGESVIRGEPFATTAGDRLHFEIRDGKTPVDPRPWLR